MNASKIIIAADLSRQKELDADSKIIQQIGFVVQLKRLYENVQIMLQMQAKINPCLF